MGPNYENSTVVAKGCYWNKRPFSNENEIHTNRPCQTLTYCRQKMVLTLGSTLTIALTVRPISNGAGRQLPEHGVLHHRRKQDKRNRGLLWFCPKGTSVNNDYRSLC
jgi:hypothetical protein